MEELEQAARTLPNGHLDAGIEQAERHQADIRHPDTWDTVYLHGISLLRHALIYTEVRHAVKYRDPGRMKAMFHYLIPIFKSTGKHKYANELLEVMTRWKCEWSDDLKATILGHSLVNSTGKPDGWNGIDLWQEHDVRLHKVDFPIGDSRGKDGNNLHEHISGILHTLRSAKSEFWQKLDITTGASQAKDIRSSRHILTHARDWNNCQAVKWIPGRKSDMFESYRVELKEQRGESSGEENAKNVSIDPLQNGVRLLVSGSKSLEAFSARRRGGIRLRDLQRDLAEEGEEEDEDENDQEEEDEEVGPQWEVDL